MKITKKGIAPYFMKISKMRDQLQELGEVISDREMTTILLKFYLRIGATSHQAYMPRGKLPH